MKLTICANADFVNEIIEVREELDRMGVDVYVPMPSEDDVTGITSQYRFDLLKDHFDKIQHSSGILILNYPEDGKENYIGITSLIEMAVAFFLRKKIFILNELPTGELTEEVKAMKPILLHGKLETIKGYL